MEIATIAGETRTAGGRHANERVRRRGLVPAVIYGRGQAPETVALSRHDLDLALEHLQHVIRLDIGGQQQQYLIQDVQFDHLHKTPIHVDLKRVGADERVKVKVQLELKGEPHGVHEGGILVQMINDLQIECLLLEIPEVIRANVTHLGVGQALHVREVELPPGVKVLHGPDDLVAICRHKRLAEEAPVAAPAEGEVAAEPEVIGRVAKEEEGEAKEE